MQDSEEERNELGDDQSYGQQEQNHQDDGGSFQEEEEKYQKSSTVGLIFKCMVCAVVGVVMGFVTEKARGNLSIIYNGRD